MTAHVRKLPRKCTFALIYGERILGLDVNPARVHNIKMAATKVSVSHWRVWPCDVAEPDDRDLIHVQWFSRFMERAGIDFIGLYEGPPYMADQLGMFDE
jgi:hypothetical protein